MMAYRFEENCTSPAINLAHHGMSRHFDRSEPRHQVQISVRLKSSCRLALDSATAMGDAIAHATITDISHGGLLTEEAGHLTAGSLVMLEVPFVGMREAEVQWVAGDRAGCRFTQPLTHEELYSAIFSSSAIADQFPGLAN
jgi:hypothetical protein